MNYLFVLLHRKYNSCLYTTPLFSFLFSFICSWLLGVCHKKVFLETHWVLEYSWDMNLVFSSICMKIMYFMHVGGIIIIFSLFWHLIVCDFLGSVLKLAAANHKYTIFWKQLPWQSEKKHCKKSSRIIIILSLFLETVAMAIRKENTAKVFSPSSVFTVAHQPGVKQTAHHTTPEQKA